MRVKCLAQEHNTMPPARARTRTARSGVEHTNHEATAPPTVQKKITQIRTLNLKSFGNELSCRVAGKNVCYCLKKYLL